MITYPNLKSEIARKGLKLKAISAYLGISGKALSNKMNGRTSFTWSEVCKIRDYFFPDVDKDYLFEALHDTAHGKISELESEVS